MIVLRMDCGDDHLQCPRSEVGMRRVDVDKADDDNDETGSEADVVGKPISDELSALGGTALDRPDGIDDDADAADVDVDAEEDDVAHVSHWETDGDGIDDGLVLLNVTALERT